MMQVIWEFIVSIWNDFTGVWQEHTAVFVMSILIILWLHTMLSRIIIALNSIRFDLNRFESETHVNAVTKDDYQDRTNSLLEDILFFLKEKSDQNKTDEVDALLRGLPPKD